MMDEDIETRLAAWLDGALPPDEAAQFAALVAADPELAARAERWRANDGRLAGAFRQIAEAPLPPGLVEKLGLAPPAVALAPVPANDNPSFWWRHRLALGGTLAASLAAVIAVAMLAPRGNPAQDALSLALDQTPSQATTVLADGTSVQPVLTVRAADGRWCREFLAGRKRNLACRDARGWRMVASGQAAVTADPTSFGLAGGERDPALDAAYTRIGAGDPLSADAERGLIAKHWRRD